MKYFVNEEQSNDVKQHSNRNSLIELYRFLFSLWVVWYHGYFAFKNQYFSHGYIAVEFFFILSGFYIFKTIEKQTDKPFFCGLWNVLWSRTKSLGLPFVVGLIFVVWNMILEGQISILGYLWYIPFMLLSFALIYSLKRLIKNNKIINIILIVIVVVSYVLLYVPILPGWGLFRGLGGVCIGALVSQIPKINFKLKKFDFNWLITFLLFATVVVLAFLPKTNMISEYFLVFLLFPMLIYFTSTLSFSCKLLNFLGSLSFGLYAYQCVLRVLEFYVALKQLWLFLILIGLVLVGKLTEFFLKKAITKLRSKRRVETQT